MIILLIILILYSYYIVNHFKVENPILKGKLDMPWCRTTLCLQKKDDAWLVVHQHISMPVDLLTGQAIVLKNKPKLRLVV